MCLSQNNYAQDTPPSCNLSVNLGENLAICQGESANLTAAVIGGFGQLTYTWSQDVLSLGANVSVSPVETTTYSVTVTDMNNCTCTKTVIVIVNMLPPQPFSVHFFGCGSTKPKAHSNPYSYNQTFEWYTTADRTGTIIPSHLIQEVAEGQTSLVDDNVFNTSATILNTSYYVFEKSIKGCYSPVREVPITVYPLPQQSADIISPSFGCGDSLNVVANGHGNTIQWRTSFNSFIGETLHVGNTFTVRNAQFIWAVEVTENGCYGAATPVNIILNPRPNAPTIANIFLCVGDASQPIYTNTNYRWYTLPTGDFPRGTPVDIPTNFPNSSTYFISQITGGCESTDRTEMHATVNTPPSTPSVKTILQPTCSVSTGTIELNSINEIGILYSFDNGETYENTFSKSNLSQGIHKIKVKNVSGCVSETLEITLNPAPFIPQAPTVTVTQPTCTVSTGSITVTRPLKGVSYSFNNDTTYQASNVKSSLSNQNYLVVVKDSLSGCVSPPTNAFIDYAPSNPINYSIAASDTTVCKGSTMKLSISPLCATCTYRWSTEQTTASIFVTPSLSTEYTVTITDNSCVAGFAKTITVEKLPKAILSIVQPTCSALGSITITNLPAGAFSKIEGQPWVLGKTFYSNLGAGEYEIKIKRNECTSEKETTLVAPAYNFDLNKCYKIVNLNSEKALEVLENRTWNNVPIIQNTYTNSLNQKWQFSMLPNGFIKIKAQSSNKFLTCNDNYNTANVVQFDYTAGGQKDWKIECLGGGEYRILHKNSNRYLSVENNYKFNKAKIEIRNWQYNVAQKWSIIEVPCVNTTTLRQADILSAKAEGEAQRIKILWHSNLGDKTNYYTIQKFDTQTERFEDLKKLNNTYFDSEMHPFTFYDAAPTEGGNVYRVKASFQDGSVQLSETLKVAFGDVAAVRLFPNPAADFIDIQLPEMPKGEVVLRLNNMFGKAMAEKKFEGLQSLHFEMGDLPNGIYQLLIMRQGKRSMVQQVVIQK